MITEAMQKEVEEASKNGFRTTCHGEYYFFNINGFDPRKHGFTEMKVELLPSNIERKDVEK